MEPSLSSENINNNLKYLKELFETHSQKQKSPSGLTLRCLDENWLSNVLAWLLDPKGSHGLGVHFADEFISTIAKERSNRNYARRNSHLKYGKSGKGIPSTGFRVLNSTVNREFYIPGECFSLQGLRKKNFKRTPRQNRSCDIVFMDLDTKKESIIIFIENKLFTSNHILQLVDMLESAEQRYKRVDIREYVYLTLTGSDPKKHFKDELKNSLGSFFYEKDKRREQKSHDR